MIVAALFGIGAFLAVITTFLVLIEHRLQKSIAVQQLLTEVVAEAVVGELKDNTEELRQLKTKLTKVREEIIRNGLSKTDW